MEVYEDHVPSHEWLREEGADTLIVHVPGTQAISSSIHAYLRDFVFVTNRKLLLFSGFKKEHLKVIICRDGKLVATGERPLPTYQKRSRRFREEFQLPEKCNVERIEGKLEDGIMRVVFPKLHHPDAANKGMGEKRDDWKKMLKTVSMGIGLHELAMVGLVMAVTVAAWCLCHKLDRAEIGRHGVFPAT